LTGRNVTYSLCLCLFCG